MTEETPSKDQRTIRLTAAEYRDLERALQWPEDLPKWDRIDRPTRLDELNL